MSHIILLLNTGELLLWWEINQLLVNLQLFFSDSILNFMIFFVYLPAAQRELILMPQNAFDFSKAGKKGYDFKKGCSSL
jgi:hypothetical protein